MERMKNRSKYLDDRSLYFEQVDTQQWSLINFLNWRSQCYTGALDREKEHGTFKCLLQSIANGKSTDRAKKAQAQELLNGWQTIKNSSEVKAFWDEQKLSKLQNDIMLTKLQNKKKSMKIQSDDLDYIIDRKKELNEHANAIGRKRYELIEQNISDSSSNDVEEKASKRKTVSYDDDNDTKVGSPSKKMMTDYSSPVMSPSSKSSDSTYIPSSLNSVNSIISEEFSQRRKQYYIQYFVGPGVVDWSPDNPKWVINDVDVSDMCCNYRASVIEKCESKMILNATEELALSHIFVFEEGNPQGLREYFDDELWEDIFNEFRGIYPNSSIPEGVYDIFMNVNKIVFERPNYKERQDAVRNYLQSRKQEEIMVEIIRNLAENEQSSFTKNYKIEDTHVHYNIAPILNPFFKKNRKTVIDWANTTSESSAMANKSFDQTLSGVKPDLIVRTTNPKKHVELLIGEIKPHNTKDKMVAMDLVNLGKTMKNALDKSIKDGVDDLIVCGLQVIGFLGRVYILDLQYEGIYRMILIGECQFPEGVMSWGTVLGCYQALATIQNIINEGAAKYQTAIRNKKQINSEKVRMSKPTFHSPMKVPYSPNH